MFVLKKVLTPFMLPPGIFIMASIFWGFWHLFQKKIRTGILLVLFGCSMWLPAIAPVSNTLLRGLEKDIVQPKQVKGDVLIMLGGGVYDQVPDLTGVGFPGAETLARIVTTVRLQHRLHIPIVVSGGKVFNNVQSEAQIVKRFLIDLGVPVEQIIVEEKSRDTFENALYTKKICDTHHFIKPVLVTSAYHMKRSLISFKKVGQPVMPFPSFYRSWEKRDYGWHDYLPGGFGYTQIAVKEYLGIIYTKLFL